MNVMSLQSRHRTDAMYDFVNCAAELLASDDEVRRRHLEDRLLGMLPDVRETPIFSVFAVRNPALRAMLDDDDEPAPTFTDQHPACQAF